MATLRRVPRGYQDHEFRGTATGAGPRAVQAREPLGIP